jgi:hypothetical protein
MVPAAQTLHTHAAILDDDVTAATAGNDSYLFAAIFNEDVTAAAAVWATLLFAAILDDDVTAAAACTTLFISLPFCICDVMSATTDPVSAIFGDDGIITVKAQQLFHVH